MVVREIPRFIQYKRGVSGVQLAASLSYSLVPCLNRVTKKG